MKLAQFLSLPLLLLLMLLPILTASQLNFTYQKCTQLSFLPMPKSIKCNITSLERRAIKDPCKIVYVVKSLTKQAESGHLYKLVEDQMYRTFRCRTARVVLGNQTRVSDAEIVVNIQAMDLGLKSAFNQKEEAYTLVINKDSALIQARHYVGLVRGLETFLQSITCGKKNKNCYMVALPIEIEDEPLFQYRGLLVDSSRHFLPMKILKETVDAMMYNKMNILHWHIVDQDSFPLVLESHPQIAEHASFSVYERYSVQEVKEFIHYAMVRGVRVIPEIDTPGHAASWARAPQNAGVACTFQNSKYKGPLDVTLHKTYELVREVFKEVFELFPDPYVHLGGDEVTLTCLANKTDFIRLENIKQPQIEIHYRKKQRQILKSLNSTKKFIYWANEQSILPQFPDDIVHWWGNNPIIPPHVKDNKLIISQFRGSGQFYIDMGAGSIKGTQYFSYATWQDMYQINIAKQIDKYPNKGNVIGAIVTLWGEMSNQYTHHAKIWVRSSSVAERAWTDQEHRVKPDFFRRIARHERLMNRRGIPTAPTTCQQCEVRPQFC